MFDVTFREALLGGTDAQLPGRIKQISIILLDS